MQRDELYRETIATLKHGDTKNEDTETPMSAEETQNEAPLVTPMSANTDNGDTLIQTVHPAPIECRLYKRRWIMLSLYVACSMANGVQWLQYSIITDVVQSFYHASRNEVHFTSIVYMLTYILFIIPALWLLGKKGVRPCMIIGALCTMIGAWLKVMSTRPERFNMTMIGQTISGIGQVFILNLSTRLAAVWFGPSEVSTSCSIGVLGTQLGIALCFLLSPLLIQKRNDFQAMTSGLSKMYYGSAIFSTIIFALICFFIEEMPTLPPSVAQANQRLANNNDQANLSKSMGRLIRNKGFALHLISYGINVGSFYAISTQLNSSLLVHFPDNASDVGNIGILIVVAGMVGSVVCGFVLDRTHMFKETTFILYACSVFGLIVYTITLSFKHIYAVYLSAILLGVFMTSYLPVGFELGAELTYPESEGTSAGLLNASVQVFGIIFTFAYEWIFNVFGDIDANIFLAFALIVGTYLTAKIPSELRRQAAQENKSFN